MTFDQTDPTMGTRSNFDSGPLSWVMDEIREALNQSRTALLNAIAKDSDSGSSLLNHAGAYLHQAHGALQIVDVDGASIITEAVEDILRRIAAEEVPLKRATIRIIEQAYQALIEYLEELLAGEPPQPMRLFPYYKELQALRGAERIHPADLFFPNLEVSTRLAPTEPMAAPDKAAIDIGRLRPRFERALLALLTTHNAPSAVEAVADLRDVVGAIAQTQSDSVSSGFWHVMHGFTDMVASSESPIDLFNKQVCGRMNRQIKLLAQGSSGISDRLLLDALYCIAASESDLPRLRDIREAYRLAGIKPADYETRRYGLIDTVALGLAKSALAQAKNTWHRVTKNEDGAAKTFELLLRQLLNVSAKLNSDPMAKLISAVGTATSDLSTIRSDNPLGLEIAADLLFIENTLDHLNRVSDDFPQRVDALINRLEAIARGETPAESAQWLDDLAQQSQQRQTVAVLSGEMVAGLRQVENILTDYFTDPAQYRTLAEADPILNQIAGVLSILGQEHAKLAVRQTQADVKQYLEANNAAAPESRPGIEFPQRVMPNITALGFFVEILPQHPESARSRFIFDPSTGILNANLLERGTQRPAALTSADPSYDPLLDVDEYSPSITRSPAQPIGVSHANPEPLDALPTTDEEIDAELLDIFMSEAEDVLDFVKHALPEARKHATDQGQLSTLRRSFHTLKGSGRMVGLTAFADAAYSVEKVMNQWLAESRSGTDDLFALLDTSVDVLGKWVADLRQSGKAGRTPLSLCNAAERVKSGLPFEFVDAEQDAALLPSASNVIEFPIVASPPLSPDDSVKRIGNLEVSVPLFNIYVAEADDLLRYLAQDFSEWRHEPSRPVTIRAIHSAHSLAGSSATVGLTPVQDVAHALERYLETLEFQPATLSAAEFDALQRCIDEVKRMMQQVALGEMPASQPALLQRLRWLQQNAATPAARAPTMVEADATVAPVPDEPPLPVLQDNEDEDDAELSGEVKDSHDPDLLPVFLDEGRDLLPQIGEALRNWQRDPGNADLLPNLLRQLHTVKGSARMAGAMELGQQLHLIETHIEHILQTGAISSAMLDGLLARHDHNLLLFDNLQHPDKEKPAPIAAPSAPIVVKDDASLPLQIPSGAMPTLAPTSAPKSASPIARVRVRADILDRLVNQAGEVSISRSKIENEVDTLRQSLSDLTDNLSRLRNQLREVEIQAESQITSRMAQTADREFDPLEFDRFSRLQELTRMMTESVDDVASIQDSLSRTVSGATSDLENQAQLTRALQQDLMQVRMVPFASIAERLYQIARQTSKEVSKPVSLDIKGTSVEVDRGVLERMAGPLEHLLRNAIVHGIEPREDREIAGKAEAGELLVEIKQEGNEVTIQLSDDGQGLDLKRIRDRAIAIGLIPEDREMTDTELENLIFQTGFSTADEVTTLAGRGIGLDVVRAEAASLGGRVNVRSTVGKGTSFIVNLPLTLAVTSVVLLNAGGNTYAVPSVLVEQVQQLRNAALVDAYGEGSLKWQDTRAPICFLSTLLGDTQSTPIVQPYTPVLILRSGSDRIALHVDEIVGNREVVVKNIGPQLARMIGIVGATVLGSGNIVLILDPVPLANRALSENTPRILSQFHAPSVTTESAGETAPSFTASAGDESTEPVQALRKKNIVMVVDDSLTVRRVTQRFLQREGYQVVLAKDGVDALEKLQGIKPDIMLVDIEMPRMDGFDLIRNVRNDSRVARTPIIMITSRTASKHRNYAMELGANEYYGKPFQEQQLLDTIEEFVGKPKE